MAQNIDRAINKSRTIISYVNLFAEVDGQTMKLQLLATELEGQRIFLGFPWLSEHNLDINWQTGKFKWQTFWPLKVKRYHDKLTPQKEELKCLLRLIKTHDNLEVKLYSDLPTQGSLDMAGYDLYSTEDKIVLAHGKMIINTQISIATPPGTYGCIAPQSRLAAKNMIATGAGVIDVGYRGIIFVLLFNHLDKDLKWKKETELCN